jgi:UDP-N-acetylglucosamine--N-acetylmuramyl-(pentapeptide) pyrophosphoryl-undecaprenol N-acetylglucosamine transferase
VPAALALLPAGQRPLVTHQTGNAHHADVKSAYADAGVEAEVLPFIDDMAAQLSRCDLMLCRAGAITVSELCAAGVPSLLVPLTLRFLHVLAGCAQHPVPGRPDRDRHGVRRRPGEGR